jgi:seryl-tRNA synthetase
MVAEIVSIIKTHKRLKEQLDELRLREQELEKYLIERIRKHARDILEESEKISAEKERVTTQLKEIEEKLEGAL